jgi:pimeloyl-ACP methyl ester carboxylesterase
MSFLTKLPLDLYRAGVFDGFEAKRDFLIADAYAMAWMSQLAYETDDQRKIERVLGMWKCRLVPDGIVVREVSSPLPTASTHCIVADCPKSIVIAFAGTDPVVLANWITDFDVHLEKSGAARGFEVAAAVVFDSIKALVDAELDKKIVVTGHSLGGALAVLVAQRLEAAGRKVESVYTFGMPRPGDEKFRADYGTLGQRTYRLVHGDDVVPTVAPASLGLLHVGRYLHCERMGRFDAGQMDPATESDKPDFQEGVAKELASVLHGALAGEARARLESLMRVLAGAAADGVRTDAAGILIDLLPPRLRDHMPDRYMAACSG